MKKVLLINVICCVLFFKAASGQTITDCVFGYDSIEQAVTIDLAQFPLDVETQIRFIFSDTYPPLIAEGGAIIWNQDNTLTAGLFQGSIDSPSYSKLVGGPTTLNYLDHYHYYAHDQNFTNNFLYYADPWEYQSGNTTIRIKPFYKDPIDLTYNLIPVTEQDFYNNFYFAAEIIDGGSSPTEWQRVVPIPGTVWLLGSCSLLLLVVKKRFDKF